MGVCLTPACSPICLDGAPCGNDLDCASQVCTSGTCETITSCAQLNTLRSFPSGMYLIHPSPGEQYTVFCDLYNEGGGWTLIFVPSSPSLSSMDLDYTTDSPALLAASTEVFVAFRTSVFDVVAGSDWAMFPITSNWQKQSPFKYQDTDEAITVMTVSGGVSGTTLRYGYAYFSELCADAWDTGANWGRLCFENTDAPYYGGWATGDGNGCSSSRGEWADTLCTANNVFTIGVR
jgi:Fibrinogen beta and gamma chains, C-terminal globular domain